MSFTQKYLYACLILCFSSLVYAADKATTIQPTFDEHDANRPHISVTLTPVASGISMPTDIQFFPNSSKQMVVLEKTGTAKIFSLQADKVVATSRIFFQVDVDADSEMGLLGLSFHPDYNNTKYIYINYTPFNNGNLFSRIARLKVDAQNYASNEETILEVAQPYSNHKAGQLAFGPDKYLYIGWGDGGSGGDPQGNGQNLKTWLGKMLRIDVDKPENGKLYSIPSDNPFVHDSRALPEIWAYGLRNPWRYSFDNQGRLIVADVGQNNWEEIDIVGKGFNLGWNKKEGSHCYPPNTFCLSSDLIDPIYEYGREDGASVTGGYVYNGPNPQLKNKYIFGDFVSGHLWALELPKKYIPNKSKAKAYSLGVFKSGISTFGRDNEGNVYVADLFAGIIYRID